MSGARGGPFSPRVALILVLGGALAFIALLWAVGSGMADPEPQPSGAHVGGKGLTGFAALSDYLKARGFAVAQTRTRGPQRRGGLLVLTPQHRTRAAELTRVINDHRQYGPTLLIMPKWIAQPLPPTASAVNPKVKPGFVQLVFPLLPKWAGFHDEVSVEVSGLPGKAQGQTWFGMDQSAPLANPKEVVSGKGRSLIPLVNAGTDRRMLVGYFSDGNYPGLADYALARPNAVDDTEEDSEPAAVADPAQENDPSAVMADPNGDAARDEASEENPEPVTVAPSAPKVAVPQRYPVIVVFEPDLLNNYGFAHQENALLAEALVRGALGSTSKQVFFDLTLAGYGRSESLLELAFTPPFLAATLCLLLAAAVALWRAYHRFGPPLLAGRSIAFGKRALVGNAAGLLRRAKRLHLLGAPYADAARERLVKALALPQRLDPAAAEAAIDRALLARTGAADAFSSAAAALRAARRPRDMLRAAQTLNSLERTLLQ